MQNHDRNYGWPTFYDSFSELETVEVKKLTILLHFDKKRTNNTSNLLHLFDISWEVSDE